MRQGTCLAIVVGLCLGSGSFARAGAMRLDYSGVITQAGSAFGLAEGQRFSGSITYDTDNGGRLAIPGFGQYFDGVTPTHNGAQYTLQLGTGAETTDRGGLTISLAQGPWAGGTNDETKPPSAITFMGGPGSRYYLTLGFKNDSAAIFPETSPGIPAPTSLSLSDFPKATFLLAPASGRTDDPNSLLKGTINSVSLTALPSPLPDGPPVVPPFGGSGGGMTGGSGGGSSGGTADGSGGATTGGSGGATTGGSGGGTTGGSSGSMAGGSSGADPTDTTPLPPVAPPINTPEPTSLALLGLGLAALVRKARRGA